MKYYTKEWQKRISDAPDNARTLADEARTGYRAEQSKNPVPEEFERKLEFHDAKITSAVMDENNLHLYYGIPAAIPLNITTSYSKMRGLRQKNMSLKDAISSTTRSIAIFSVMKCICSSGIMRKTKDSITLTSR